MKISTEIGTLENFMSAEQAITLVAQAGFDAWDLSLFSLASYDFKNRAIRETAHPLHGREYLSYVRRLRAVGEECGLVCNQSHAPFPSHVPGMREYLKRALECTAEAGGEICVIHPDGATREEAVALILELLPFARACGVKMGIENIAYRDKALDAYMPHYCSDPERIVSFLDEIGDPFAVACLDIAHAELKGLGANAVDMIKALGGRRLQALHIHDNDRWHDQHKLPFTGEIDFAAVTSALKAIGYGGYFTMECDSFIKSTAPTDPVGCARGLAEAARRLARMFDEA